MKGSGKAVWLRLAQGIRTTVCLSSPDLRSAMVASAVVNCFFVTPNSLSRARCQSNDYEKGRETKHTQEEQGGGHRKSLTKILQKFVAVPSPCVALTSQPHQHRSFHPQEALIAALNPPRKRKPQLRLAVVALQYEQ